MAELKPCPFCGGGASLRSEWMSDGYRYTAVVCTECGVIMPGNYSVVGDQATWDWNARWERTCRDDGRGVFRCSECGAFAKRGAVMDLCREIPIRYCPNCGAKVVSK